MPAPVYSLGESTPLISTEAFEGGGGCSVASAYDFGGRSRSARSAGFEGSAFKAAADVMAQVVSCMNSALRIENGELGLSSCSWKSKLQL